MAPLDRRRLPYPRDSPDINQPFTSRQPHTLRRNRQRSNSLISAIDGTLLTISRGTINRSARAVKIAHLIWESYIAQFIFPEGACPCSVRKDWDSRASKSCFPPTSGRRWTLKPSILVLGLYLCRLSLLTTSADSENQFILFPFYFDKKISFFFFRAPLNSWI